MNSPTFLDRYSGQTTAELLALEGVYRIDSLILAFEQGLDQKSAKRGASSLNSVELIVLAIEALEREVNNGGYDQFFRNSSVEYAPIVVASLDTIGCPNTAQITLDAIAALGLSQTPKIEEIEKVMTTDNEERDEKLNDCDSRYYATGENIASALFTYLKSHSNEVILP